MTTTAGRVYAGLRPGTTTDSLRVAVSNGALADHLACFAPKPGDAILLPAGTVHAVGGGAVVFEVSENSDVTFRLYDWDHVDAGTGQPRAVQVDQAIDCTNFVRGALGLAAPVVEETTPMSCSCRRLSVRARSGRGWKRPCWKSAYLDRRPKSARRERETINRLRPGRHPGAEQNGP